MSEQGPGQPEYIDQGGRARTRRGTRLGRRRGVALASVAGVAALAAVGVGTYGLVQLLSGGSSPATAVPADAIGYISLDLDPSAGQKIEAIKIMRKFPGLKKEIGLDSRDDVRKRIVEEIHKDGGCSAIDYDRDVKPWIGNRIALAAVPASKNRILPLVAIQVSDQDKAEAAVHKLEDCDRSDDLDRSTGVAFSGDYLLVTEKQSDADAMAKGAASAPLAEDPDYKTWMSRVGDPGIISLYASEHAGDRVITAQRDERRRMAHEFGGGTVGFPDGQLERMVGDFKGAAGVVRFHHGAVEVEFADKGLRGVGSIPAVGGGNGPDVRTLPATTAAVVSMSLRHGWLDGYVEQLKSMVGDRNFEQMVSAAEQQTGLNLPEDVGDLLGDGVSVSVDSSADLHKLADSPDPADLPVGIRIKGDPGKVIAVIAKLKAAAGPEADVVRVSDNGRDLVGVGTSRGYVDKLLQKGDLGSTRAFQDVVPEADRAGSLLFVDFDAGHGWSEKLADLLSNGDRNVRANIAPLEALGISGWTDGGVEHSLVRLTTD